MRLVLQPMPQPEDGGICVGLLDGEACTFHGRTAIAGGREYEAKQIAGDILAAVEEAAREMFGPEWVQSLALVSGLNARTCQRDRIGRYGLPAPVLRALGEGAAYTHARALGDIMLATARVARAEASFASIQRSPGVRDILAVDAAMYRAFEEAKRLVSWLAQQRAEHRAPALDGE